MTPSYLLCVFSQANLRECLLVIGRAWLGLCERRMKRRLRLFSDDTPLNNIPLNQEADEA